MSGIELPNNFFQEALRFRGDPSEHPVRVKAHMAPWKNRKGVEEMAAEFEQVLRLNAAAYYDSFQPEVEARNFLKQAEPEIKRLVGMFKGVLEADAARLANTRSTLVIKKRERAVAAKRGKRREWTEELDE